MDNDKNIKKSQSSIEKMNSGSLWMSSASIISRILGVLYIIPWIKWMGTPQVANEANALFGIGYRWYALFLAVAVAGVPSAISKLIANYNANGQYRTAKKLFKSAVILMMITGIIASIILWIFAPQFAKDSPARSLDYSTTVIRSLVPALMVIPTLSILRGFFQGYQDMKPSAISQIMEQLFRIGYMLVAVYYIRVVNDGSMIDAVVQSTFGAFIGAIIAIITLLFYFIKNKNSYIIPSNHQDTINISTRSLLIEVIKLSIPFIISGSVIEISQLIDTKTYMPIMENVSSFSQEALINDFAAFSTNANKLITVLVSLALSIATASIPILSATYANEKLSQSGIESKKWIETTNLITNNLYLFTIIMLPSTIGVAILARPIYALIYFPDENGTWFLQLSCFMAISMGLFSLMVSSMQALNFQKEAILGILIGLIIKCILQYPLLWLCGTSGALYSTTISFLIMSIYYTYYLKKVLDFPFRKLFKKLYPVIFSTIIMTIISFIVYKGIQIIIPVNSALGNLLIIILVGIIGGITYLLLGLRYQFIDIILGNKTNYLRNLLYKK